MESARNPSEEIIDIRAVPRPQRHQLVSRAYEELEVGAGLILVDDHEPTDLRLEMEQEYAEALGWQPLRGTGEFRVRITKAAATALPRVVGETGRDVGETGTGDRGIAAADTETPTAHAAASGSVWQLRPRRRDLDANVIALAPRDEIRDHVGPGLDVLIHVLAGSGTLTTELTEIRLEPGQIVWLPRRSRRRILAGDHGLRYFSVHQRKQGLSISSSPPPRTH